MESQQIGEWLVLRWQWEVTLHAGRAHLGRLRRQRLWSDRASPRTTPARFGRCSLVTLLAQQVLQRPGRVAVPHQAGW